MFLRAVETGVAQRLDTIYTLISFFEHGSKPRFEFGARPTSARSAIVSADSVRCSPQLITFFVRPLRVRQRSTELHDGNREQTRAFLKVSRTPPTEPVMARIKAPVAAFFGANDLGLAPRVAPATTDMKRLRKSFTVEVYPEATPVFLCRQDLGKKHGSPGGCLAEGNGVFQAISGSIRLILIAEFGF